MEYTKEQLDKDLENQFQELTEQMNQDWEKIEEDARKLEVKKWHEEDRKKNGITY